MHRVFGLTSLALPRLGGSLALPMLLLLPLIAFGQDQSAKQVADLEAQIGPLYAAGKFADVYPLLEEQLKLQIASSGHESAPAIATLVRLGDCLGKQQKFLEAAKPFAEALNLHEKRNGKDDAETLRLHSLTGGMLACGGKYQEAERHFQAALDGRKRLYGEEHALTAASYRELAWAINSQGRHKEAEPLAQTALTLHQRHSAADRDGESQILNLLAYTLYHQQKFAEAEPLFEKNLAICREIFGGEHARTLTAIRTLADAQRLAGKHAAALVLLEEFNPLAECILGRGHAERIEGLALTAACHRALNRPADEERALAEMFTAEASPTTAMRPDYRPLQRSLLACLATQGKWDAALERLAVWWPAEAVPAGPPDREMLTAAQLLAAEAYGAHLRGRHDEAIDALHRLVDFVSGPTGRPTTDRHQFLLGYCCYVLGEAHHAKRELAEARKQLEASLSHYAAALPKETYPDGHRNIAQSLAELADVMHGMGEYGKSGNYCRQALEMNRKLYPVSRYPDGEPALARSLMKMAFMEGGGPNAIPLYEDALDQQRRLLAARKLPGGEFELINTLNQLGNALVGQAKVKEGVGYLEEALTLLKRRGSRSAVSHQFLARALTMNGQLEEAEQNFAEAVAIYREGYTHELFPHGHDYLVQALAQVGLTRQLQGKSAEAIEPLLEAANMSLELAADFFAASAEAEALNFAVNHLEHPDLLVSAWLYSGRPADDLYAYVWKYRGLIYRALARRQQALAASAGPDAARLYDEYLKLRQTLGSLMYAPLAAGSGAAAERRQQLSRLTEEKERLERRLAEAVPALADQLRQQPEVGELVASLPADAAFVDFLHVELTPRRALPQDDPEGPRYVAFLVQRDRPIELIELGSAAAIDKLVAQWRGEIDGDRAAASGGELRKRLLDPWARGLASGVKRIYFCPDGQLAAVPWGALPRAAGGFLVEQYAFAAVPHGQALLPTTQRAGSNASSSGRLLLVGDIEYGSSQQAERWPKLPGSALEIAEVAGLAAGRPATLVARSEATAERVLSELPAVQYAHFATHGFFADRELRSALQLDPGLFDQKLAAQRSLRSNVAGRNPLLLSALVLAGANRSGEGSQGGGLLFAEAIAGRPLGGLDLAVLSACETGLGDVAGGEGVFGLARAFHLAGTQNVVASLWKVDDAATAAQMRLFYHHLWTEKREPIDALREAQLALMRRPDLVPQLAANRGINFTKTVELTKAKPAEPGKTPVRLWAAFVVSTAVPPTPSAK